MHPPPLSTLIFKHSQPSFLTETPTPTGIELTQAAFTEVAETEDVAAIPVWTADALTPRPEGDGPTPDFEQIMRDLNEQIASGTPGFTGVLVVPTGTQTP